MAKLEIRPLTDADADLWLAARLFCGQYAALRSSVAAMPARYADPAGIHSLLLSLAAVLPLIGAYEQSGRMVGYLGGWPMPEFKGTDKGMYCPEWAHAVAGDHGDRAAVYHRLYAAAAETWVADGRLNHAVTALGNEQDTLDAWFWLGFGLVVVDAVRDLSPIMTPTAGRFATYRLATATDIPELFPLYCEHQLYYQHSPMFEPKVPLRDANELAELMADPRKQLWLAAGPDGGILGFVEGTANSTDACTIVRDPSTLACTGAYLTPRLRGQGIGAGLLGEMVQWAADHGFVRLSLDFESANGPGRRFWLSHCSPACYSVLRHVNNRVLGHRPLA